MTAWKCETGKGICGSDAAVGADSGPEFGELGREGGVDGEWIPGVELLHRTAFGQLGVDVDPELLQSCDDFLDHFVDGPQAVAQVRAGSGRGHHGRVDRAGVDRGDVDAAAVQLAPTIMEPRATGSVQLVDSTCANP
jgi:hypothetical protein